MSSLRDREPAHRAAGRLHGRDHRGTLLPLAHQGRGHGPHPVLERALHDPGAGHRSRHGRVVARRAGGAHPRASAHAAHDGLREQDVRGSQLGRSVGTHRRRLAGRRAAQDRPHDACRRRSRHQRARRRALAAPASRRRQPGREAHSLAGNSARHARHGVQARQNRKARFASSRATVSPGAWEASTAIASANMGAATQGHRHTWRCCPTTVSDSSCS